MRTFNAMQSNIKFHYCEQENIHLELILGRKCSMTEIFFHSELNLSTGEKKMVLFVPVYFQA